MKYDYYWNNIPGVGLARNNLIYTSLISEDKKTFVQWYYNDVNYHKDQNEVVDPELMRAKWDREICFLYQMSQYFPEHVPKIKEINVLEKKIYLEIDGIDFWNRAGCLTENYDKVLPDWQDQMIDILQAYRALGWYKFSLHPSSYFIVDGKLKSINHFFVYTENEGPISIADHSSHIHSQRQAIMREQVEAMGLDWNEPQPLNKLQQLCFESFRTNYPDEFIERAKGVYSD